ncbi:hypothetical protein INR49_019121 [Caranx melampygus]|nr:hypothetical protein INR49_019121 [Caranx melampygus]
MAEELLETVDRLQSRLLENPEPRKLLKTLKRLGELPMTVDILVPHEGGARSHTHSRGLGGGGDRHVREPSPEEEPTYMEEEEEEKPTKHSKKSSTQEKKRGGDDGRPRAPKDSPPKEEEEDFETPTMSFESFLTYDAPTSVKKKKKPSSSSSSSHSRPSHSSSSTSSSHHARPPPAVTSSSSSSSSSKANKANGAQSSKRPHSGSSSSAAAPAPEKRKRVVEAVPTLPEIPLPAIQPNYRPLPSIDVTPLSPQRRKVPVFNDEEDAGFTGKRFNSKMVVYSGSKTHR